MNNYPKYVEIDNKEYKINTDFRIAIECNRIAQDETIGDCERALAIIYKLFGEKGIDTPQHYEKLLKMAEKYLKCGKEIDNKDEKIDMDFVEDYSYIKTSFMSDYGIKLDDMKMHWWEFMDLMNGLSNSEFGNCCVLNRVRNLRNFDLSQIKDSKERDRIEKAKEMVELERNKPENHLTKEQEESMNKLNEMLGLQKGGTNEN